MNNYTTNLYEIKRKILNFTKKMSNGLSKPSTKFLMDIEYGIAKNKSCLISKISRSLDEKIELKNTIERLCDRLSNMTEKENEIILNNYYKEIEGLFDDEPIALFDDSDISKKYGKKFEDLDRVIDASSPNKEIVNGYHVCEAVALGKKEKQPISLYSKIYSCQSKGFISKNEYTKDSIDTVRKVFKRKCNMVFDRGYDDNKTIDYVSKTDNIVVRIDDNRILLFKGKKKKVHDVAITRKGRIKMELWFDNKEKYEVYISHTRTVLPYNNREYNLVIVYGLSSDEHPLLLLTNREIKAKEDVIKIVRLYFYRWRIEEYFRSKKQEYEFENIRVRTLKAMNNLNLLLMIYMGHIAKMIEEMDNKLLSIKIIERSKSLRDKVVVWLSQFARGIGEILSFAHTGIKDWQSIEKREKYKQLSLNL